MGALKTFHAKTVHSLSDCEIPANSEFRPIQSLSEHEGYQSSSEVDKLLATFNRSDNNLAINTKTTSKKRRRRKKKTATEFKKDGADKDEGNVEEKRPEDGTNTVSDTNDSKKSDLIQVWSSADKP